MREFYEAGSRNIIAIHKNKWPLNLSTDLEEGFTVTVKDWLASRRGFEYSESVNGVGIRVAGPITYLDKYAAAKYTADALHMSLQLI